MYLMFRIVDDFSMHGAREGGCNPTGSYSNGVI